MTSIFSIHCLSLSRNVSLEESTVCILRARFPIDLSWGIFSTLSWGGGVCYDLALAIYFREIKKWTGTKQLLWYWRHKASRMLVGTQMEKKSIITYSFPPFMKLHMIWSLQHKTREQTFVWYISFEIISQSINLNQLSTYVCMCMFVCMCVWVCACVCVYMCVSRVYYISDSI